MTDTTTRRIYVACLASYNNGCLHGAWIETEGKDAEDITEEVRTQVLLTSPYPNVEVTCPVCEGGGTDDFAPIDCRLCHGKGTVPSAEEWAIHDHEGFNGLLGEYDTFQRVAELDEAIEKHGEALFAFLSAFGDDADLDKFSEAYQGQYESERDFAEEWAQESGRIKDDHPMFGYIDWDYYWRGDLRHSFTFENGYVFNSDW